MSTRYTVRAVHWSKGWELHVDDVGVTQVRTLGKADQQVRDLIETMTEQDATDAQVDIIPDLTSSLLTRIRHAREARERAEEASREAAADMRAVVRDLRTEENLSVTDIATVIGVSRGRVSQLMER